MILPPRERERMRYQRTRHTTKMSPRTASLSLTAKAAAMLIRGKGLKDMYQGNWGRVRGFFFLENRLHMWPLSAMISKIKFWRPPWLDIAHTYNFGRSPIQVQEPCPYLTWDHEQIWQVFAHKARGTPNVVCTGTLSFNIRQGGHMKASNISVVNFVVRIFRSKF